MPIVRNFLWAILLLTSTPSLAADAPNSCTMYFSGDTQVPEVVRSAMVGNVSAVNICTSRQQAGLEYFEAISSVVLSLQGNCIYTRRAISKSNEADKQHTWTYQAATGGSTYVMKSYGGCSRQDNEGYIPIKNVSEGVYMMLMDYWRVMNDAMVMSKLENIQRPSQLSDDYTEFYQSFMGKKGDHKGGNVVRISLIDYDEQSRSTYYSLDIKTQDRLWSLAVDIFAGQVQLIYVSAYQ